MKSWQEGLVKHEFVCDATHSAFHQGAIESSIRFK